MSTSIFIIAHAPLASALKECAAHVYSCDSRMQERIVAVDVAADADTKSISEAVAARLPRGDADEGHALVLTDLVGATPSNIAESLLKYEDVVVVTGVNVPMTLTALCHSDEPFDELVRLVVDAGLTSISRIPPVSE